jgi:hypothetical protein
MMTYGLRSGMVQLRLVGAISVRKAVAILTAVFGLLLGGASESWALFVTDNWVPFSPSNPSVAHGAGTLTFNLPGGSPDPANISAISLSALAAIQIRFNGIATPGTVTQSAPDIAAAAAAFRFTAPPPGFSAVSGYLTNTLSYSSVMPFSSRITVFTLNGGGNRATSSGPNNASGNSLTATPANETDAGCWKLAVAAVPVPASVWLLGIGLAAMVILLVRRQAVGVTAAAAA